MITEAMWDQVNNISMIVNVLLNAVLVFVFYIPFLKRRVSAVILGAVYAMVMSILYFVSINFSGLTAYALGCSAVCTASVMTERINVPQKVFLSMTMYLLLWISMELSILPWKLICSVTFMNPKVTGDLQQIMLYGLAQAIHAAIRCALMVIGTHLIKIMYRRKKELMEWRELAFLSATYITIIVSYWICTFMEEAFERASGEYFWNRYPVYHEMRALFGVIAFLTMIAVIYFYQKIKTSEEEVLQNSLVNSQIDELSGHVHTMEKIYSDIRGIRHDTNNHIMVLGNLIKENNYNQALQYLNDWSEDFHIVDINAKTGNPVTDIVISEKQRQAEEVGIRFVDDFHYPEEGKVESIDVGVILNNALSNAIRAAEGQDNPFVEIKSWRSGDMFMIQVRNSFSGVLLIPDEDGLVETSKPDRDKHGFGMKNMRRIAEKYYGTTQLEQEDGMAVFTAMMVI
ncbi:sensor histidine kinase [Butyrivibrio sp. JL13D10]|uniref:sensor histidine kinase n=1 Tax=Butyrivibrio sp. JL13D10 TaxID=3236815 RepID=UPI0038B65488